MIDPDRLRTSGSGRASGYRDHAAADGLLHRHLGVHRLQGVRGGLQGVEPGPRGRPGVTGMSYDNTVGLGADTWRHVAFIEQRRPCGRRTRTARPRAAGGGGAGRPALADGSDVCKHCTHAACLDVCPTGALFRTEFGTVVVQEDVCNGCGYCIPACPYGVIDQRKGDGRAWKCTLCYDRLGAGLTPACAKACPTESIQFGPLDELRERAAGRLAQLHEAGHHRGAAVRRGPGDGVGGDGAFFLLLEEPEVYGLPPDPVVTTRDLPIHVAPCRLRRRPGWWGPRPWHSPRGGSGGMGEQVRGHQGGPARRAVGPGGQRLGGAEARRPGRARGERGDGAARAGSPPTTASR